MRLSLRFVLPLAIVLGLVAYSVVPLVDQLTLKWFVRDMDIRTKLIANTLEESLAPLIDKRESAKVLRVFDRAIQDERLYAVGFCDPSGKLVYRTQTYPTS